MSTFALDVSKFVAKATAAPATVTRKVALDVLAKVVLRTPVGNPDNWASVKAGRAPPPGYVGGRLRANWNTSIGRGDFTTSKSTTDNAVRRGESRLRAYDGTQDIYLLNSLPYVRRIEYEGWSSQAKAGMVRITVAEFQTFVDKAVRSLPK